MKNKNAGFFWIGVILGIVIPFAAVNYQNFPALSHQDGAPTPTPAIHLPRLIALGSTDALAQVTPSSAPTTLFEPGSTPANISSKPTATPLSLANAEKPETIGYSVGGLPLEVYQFGAGQHERMIVAGIHGGDEWNTVTLANQLIAYLNQYPNEVPGGVALYILRNLNPDGEARAHDKYGRTNNNGVDLNRNFPVNWLADWDRAGCWNYLPTSGGQEAGSEPETRAIMTFIQNHKIEALISYHSAALGVFPGGYPWEANSVRLAESIAEVSSYPFPPIDTGCKYSGTLADYAVSKGIAAVDLELTNHIETDFGTNLKILKILLSWQT